VAGTEIADAASKGKLETVGWASLLFGSICLIVNFAKRRDSEQRANDICAEMDAYNMPVSTARAADRAK
jgi:hypothetical protein